MPPAVAAQEMLPSLVHEGCQSQVGAHYTPATPRQVASVPPADSQQGPECQAVETTTVQPLAVLVGGEQDKLSDAAPGVGDNGVSVSQVDPRVDAVVVEVDMKLSADMPKGKGRTVLGADTLKPTTVRRSSRSKAKADEHTL